MMLSTVSANEGSDPLGVDAAAERGLTPCSPCSRAANGLIARATAQAAIARAPRAEIGMKSSRKRAVIIQSLEPDKPARRLHTVGYQRLPVDCWSTCFEETLMRLRICVLALSVLGTSVSAFGQSALAASLEAAASQAAAQPSGESIRRLSIDDAVKLALEQNLGIRIQRIDPQLSDISVAQARACWAPNFSTSFNRTSQTLQSTNAFSGSGSSILNGVFSNQVAVNQTLPWGSQYQVTWDNRRISTT